MTEHDPIGAPEDNDNPADASATASAKPEPAVVRSRPSQRRRTGGEAAPAGVEAGRRGLGVAASAGLAVVAVIAVVAAIVFGALWASDGSRTELDELRTSLALEEEAQARASDYAMSVSQTDYRDLDAWRAALTTGVTEQLKPKLSGAVDVVGPWLTEMEYVSTAELLAATVGRQDGDVYVVQVFVDMTSTSRQAPQGVTATASYTVTLDRASGWTITDVGGVGADLPTGDGPAPEAEAPAQGAEPEQPQPR